MSKRDQINCSQSNPSSLQNIINSLSQQSITEPFSPQCKEIVVIKQKEKDNDELIKYQWKKARSHFYTHRIRQALTSVQMPGEYQTFIIDKFLTVRKFSELNIDKMTSFNQKEKKKIKQLKQQFQQMEDQFAAKQKENLPFSQILKQKLNHLQIIHIQYELVNEIYRYSISPSQFFKVIHYNKLLVQVTLKGVQVQSCHYFIRSMRQVKCGQKAIQQTEGWVKNFNPSKQLRLAFNTKMIFNITQLQLHDLIFFTGLFNNISDITVKIILGNVDEQANILQKILKSLREITSIKLQFQSNKLIINPSVIRSVLFGCLTLFSQITHLSFREFRFPLQTRIIAFLAIEELLRNIFENNCVTHLKIQYSYKFPIIPQIHSLQSIKLIYMTFRKTIGDIPRSMPNLKSIKWVGIFQEWKINEKLVNQLQVLEIGSSGGIVLQIDTVAPSNIKCLYIYGLNVDFGCLFPKLVNVNYLQLGAVEFGHQNLCNIPSVCLEELIIQKNSITDRELLQIDSKWPKLRYLRLQDCDDVTQSAWESAKLQGLCQLSVDEMMLGKQRRALKNLKSKGIKCIFS